MPSLLWDILEDRLELGVAAGFEGSLLIVRRGETALHEGYGLANREREIPNRPDTIFATGSLPIDYTFAAVLLLQEVGKLDASDPASTYIADVPEDKQAITIEYLMTGASGLRNSHDKPTDRDPDHTWIDRDEAMRRILSSELLFPLGTGREHSHLTDGITNAPPFWGKTSWLVLGSGGQVSTTGDMARFVNAVHGGEPLNDVNTGRFLRNGTGPVRRAVGQLAKDLASMVLEDSAAR